MGEQTGSCSQGPSWRRSLSRKWRKSSLRHQSARSFSILFPALPLLTQLQVHRSCPSTYNISITVHLTVRLFSNSTSKRQVLLLWSLWTWMHKLEVTGLPQASRCPDPRSPANSNCQHCRQGHMQLPNKYSKSPQPGKPGSGKHLLLSTQAAIFMKCHEVWEYYFVHGQ